MLIAASDFRGNSSQDFFNLACKCVLVHERILAFASECVIVSEDFHLKHMLFTSLLKFNRNICHCDCVGQRDDDAQNRKKCRNCGTPPRKHQCQEYGGTQCGHAEAQIFHFAFSFRLFIQPISNKAMAIVIHLDFVCAAFEMILNPFSDGNPKGGKQTDLLAVVCFHFCKTPFGHK